MNKAVVNKAEGYKRKHAVRRWLYRLFTVAAACSVFCTTYALILPAITLEVASGEVTAVSSENRFSACSCSGGTGLQAHADSCTYKQSVKTFAENNSAQQIYAVWSELDTLEKDFILLYLSWINNTKLQELNALIGGSGGSAEITCTVPGQQTVFKISGDLPADASLSVSVPAYTKEKTFSFINPNLHYDVHGYFLYDIVITSAGAEYQPQKPVTVSVTSPDFQLDADELFCVAHLDEATNSIVSSEYVDVVNGNITFTASSFSPYLFYVVDADVEGGERILGTNWMKLRDSGYFTYWQQFLNQPAETPLNAAVPMNMKAGDTAPSAQQIVADGGSETSDDGAVTVSKNIYGTEIENIFDIILTVSTTSSIEEIRKEPNMAVVIVMDISNTMNNNFGGTTRYKAAMDAAETFLDKFTASNSMGVSKIGYVAFNTNGELIFPMQACTTNAQATALKNTMRTATGDIINNYHKDSNGYVDDRDRFTNIEAGLAMAADMLNDPSITNDHKYIIFLSDGFPTTYMTADTTDGYKGIDTYGYNLYDDVLDKYCLYGTSYSDTGAIKAREKATEIKNSGTTIFSIGIAVGDQTVQKYVNQSENADGFSVVERTGTSYEIGDASSTASYKTWLGSGIGSNQYYDSTDASGLTDAYNNIFASIKQSVEESIQADWITSDPIPTTPRNVEFIGLFNQSSALTGGTLNGSYTAGGENTAVYDPATNKINWDLKSSGHTKTTTGNVTRYEYKLKYRVRLENELVGFEEKQAFPTNDTTTLTYRTVESINGVQSISDPKTITFPIPSVKGYLAELRFKKTGLGGNPLAGAQFKLVHDPTCSICRGDGNPVQIDPADPRYTQTSGADGYVTFPNIPSGHRYILTETVIPPGYSPTGNTYHVEVAYKTLTATVTDINGKTTVWDPNTQPIVNNASYELPNTGGIGTHLFTFAGGLMMAVPLFYLFAPRVRKRDD